MQRKLPELNADLQKQLAPVYLISGDTPLLLREARDSIRQAAIAHNVTQREVMHMDKGLDEARFMSLTQNMSLFGDRTLIELHNPNTKFDDKTLKTLLAYIKKPQPDITLVIISGKLTGAQKKTKWFKAFDAAGIVVQVWPVSPQELPRWIQNRFNHTNLTVDRDSIALLAEFTEGNLLATQQAIEKLKLLYNNETITVDKMANVVHQSARFNVFDLSQHMLMGDVQNTQRVITGLRQEGVEPTFILWAITRELRLLAQMCSRLAHGESLQQVLSKEWQNRKQLLGNALRRLKLKQIRTLLAQCEHIDHIIKGISAGNFWNQVEQLCIALSGQTLFEPNGMRS